jgi:ABC-type uncharacterized transport system permease subunit
MMALYHAHSGIRYLVLTFAVVALIYYAYGLITKRPFDKTARIMGIVFNSSLDINVLVGIILLIAKGYFSYQLMHIIFMIAALVTAHVLTVVNKKQEKPTYQIALFAVAIPLALIILGINSIPG